MRAGLDAWDGAVREHHEELHLESLEIRLSETAPALAQAIAKNPSDPEWSARLAYIDQAWAWRRTHSWVQEYHERSDDRQLERDLDAVEKDIAGLTARLAAERAWSACLDRTTAAQVQALQTYRDHVASIGKGTGRYAERYRAGARDAMQVAQGAVPAWVMPLQQVLASIPAEQNSFDVVIVDEASQADISSLFLLWLAPRVIVLGDDKQCAPSDVASGELDGVFSRLDSYLPDIPKYLRDSFTPRSSMFSLLRSSFGSVIRLREHFRCMPEIINWSSGQFYSDAPLVPVRQFGADRLPPLRTTFVEGGVVTGRNASLGNRVEARAIADALARCLTDKVYDGKTFGVVVLQGQAQVDIIQNELLDRLAPDQWEERRLRIGTPPDFQGDERHVVFLSMVVAPEQHIAAMTKTDYQRRFNVAASRAQDQMWLFHSRTVDSLRATDLRHSLLTYMQSTSPAPAEPMPDSVTRDDRHEAFDSLFEQRVFLDIVARGYHVNSQVEAIGRRIDLVVTGPAGKLAVECDGDHWHTSPEQQRADLERERELQRCGWKFWRIRESEYYLDPVASMAGLWVELERRGIIPHVVGVADIAAPPEEDWEPAEPFDDDSSVDDPVEFDVVPFLASDCISAEPNPNFVDGIGVLRKYELSEEAYTEAGTVLDVPEMDSSSATASSLSDVILRLLDTGPLSVRDIAKRLGADWKLVLAELDQMIDAGVVEEESVLGSLTQFRTVNNDAAAEPTEVLVGTDEIGAGQDCVGSREPIGIDLSQEAAKADEEGFSCVSRSILRVLKGAELPVIDLVDRLNINMDLIREGLDDLIDAGRIDEVSNRGELARYRIRNTRMQDELTTLESTSGYNERDDAVVEVASPETVSSRVVPLLSSGPRSLADLEYGLHESRDRVEAVLKRLVDKGEVVRLPERGPSVYGLPPQVDTGVLDGAAASASSGSSSSYSDPHQVPRTGVHRGSYRLQDYLDPSEESLRAQWTSILNRREVGAGERQENFVPCEVLLCMCASTVVDYRKFGSGSAHRAGSPVPELAELCKRPPSSILAKMANLDGSRFKGAKHEKEIGDTLRANPSLMRALYKRAVYAARAVGIGPAQLPDFLGPEDSATDTHGGAPPFISVHGHRYQSQSTEVDADSPGIAAGQALAAAVRNILADQPGITKHEIAERLSGYSRSKSEINKVLYGTPKVFRHDGGSPLPRWYLLDDGGGTQSSEVGLSATGRAPDPMQNDIVAEILDLLGPSSGHTGDPEGSADDFRDPLLGQSDVAIYATYKGKRTDARFNPHAQTVQIVSGELAGCEYSTPSGAANALIQLRSPHVSPTTNGWSFWTIDDGTGRKINVLK